jgi:hypothetical protein
VLFAFIFNLEQIKKTHSQICNNVVKFNQIILKK